VLQCSPLWTGPLLPPHYCTQRFSSSGPTNICNGRGYLGLEYRSPVLSAAAKQLFQSTTWMRRATACILSVRSGRSHLMLAGSRGHDSAACCSEPCQCQSANQMRSQDHIRYHCWKIGWEHSFVCAVMYPVTLVSPESQRLLLQYAFSVDRVSLCLRASTCGGSSIRRMLSEY
jgi:hypothetical protein